MPTHDMVVCFQSFSSFPCFFSAIQSAPLPPPPFFFSFVFFLFFSFYFFFFLSFSFFLFLSPHSSYIARKTVPIFFLPSDLLRSLLLFLLRRFGFCVFRRGPWA